MGLRCRSLVWLGRRFTVGVCRAFLMAAAVCVLRGRGACMGNFGNFWEFLRGVWGRHCIPRGFACRWEVGCVGADVPQGRTNPKKFSGETRRVSRRAHGVVCEGFLRDSSLKRSGNVPDRYMAFFAKLFFTWKKLPTGIPGVVRGTASPPDRLQQRRNRYMAFFAKLFFTWKKSGDSRVRVRRAR